MRQAPLIDADGRSGMEAGESWWRGQVPHRCFLAQHESSGKLSIIESVWSLCNRRMERFPQEARTNGFVLRRPGQESAKIFPENPSTGCTTCMYVCYNDEIANRRISQRGNGNSGAASLEVLCQGCNELSDGLPSPSDGLGRLSYYGRATGQLIKLILLVGG
jgi:hypothetical protein